MKARRFLRGALHRQTTTRWLFGLAIVLASTLTTAPSAVAETKIKAELSGYQETPAISSTCEGQFRAKISDDNSQIEFQLSYADLEGDVAQAHIHFGQEGVAGGISIYLCSNIGGPAGTPSCPGPRSGTVTGTRDATNVIGPSAQGINAGELGELIEAIHAGRAYVNVHSFLWPAGECRGQVK